MIRGRLRKKSQLFVQFTIRSHHLTPHVLSTFIQSPSTLSLYHEIQSLFLMSESTVSILETSKNRLLTEEGKSIMPEEIQFPVDLWEHLILRGDRCSRLS